MNAGDALKQRVDDAMERRMERDALPRTKPMTKNEFEVQIENQKSFFSNFISYLNAALKGEK